MIDVYSAVVDHSSIAAKEMPTLAAGSRFCRWKVLLVRGASSQVLPTDKVPLPTSSSKWEGSLTIGFHPPCILWGTTWSSSNSHNLSFGLLALQVHLQSI